MMKFSDEMINAYADGELKGSDKAEFEQALLRDQALQQALDQVVLLKARVNSAYANLDMPQRPEQGRIRYAAVMYGFLLLMAFSGGWLSGGLMDGAQPLQASLAQHGVSGERAPVVDEEPGKYILHIGTHDTHKFKSILDTAEDLVTRYQDEMRLIELEVIANASGLDLLRESASPYAQRVRDLSQRYPNIRFIACTNAIERLREKGIEPGLIKSVQQGPTALDQVVRRMNQGWTYIKI